jgi:TonB family protein
MIGKQMFTPRRVACVIAAFGLVAAPLGLSIGWAAGYEQGSMPYTSRSGAMERETTVGAPSPSNILLERSPTTIDEYAVYVQDRLQVAAMQMRQRGSAELKLTIDKDGTIRETEIVEVTGASSLRDQLKQVVNRIEPLPPLPDNVDALVVSTDLSFDYPGENLYDHYGRLPRFPG